MIELRNISTNHGGNAGRTGGLRGVDLQVGRGEIFGVIGNAGAGKTSLLRSIPLLDRPASGSVVVDGQDLTALPDAELRHVRRRIGIVFRDPPLLYSRTVHQNLALPLEIAGRRPGVVLQRVQQLLELVGLADEQNLYPAELTEGKRRRTGIARALALEPSVLLADEATTSLDSENRKFILTLLKTINDTLGLTILVATPEIEVVKEICDRVAVMDQGNLVEQGPVFDVLTRPSSQITHGFVRHVMNRELPASLIERIHATPITRGNTVLRILFTGHSANLPVISEVVRRFNLLLNILLGNVDYIQGLPYGNIVVEVIGSGKDTQTAIDFIRDNDLQVEVLGHVADHNHAVV